MAATLGVGLAVTGAACTDDTSRPSATRPTPGRPVSDWLYQLQGYPGGRLDAVARAPQPLAVIDLARNAHADYFTRAEIEAVRASGKVVLAYFEIGSIEQFRPEYPEIRQHGDLILNRWPDWPDEFFVRFWDQRWWDLAVRPRIDQAVRAGFDGIYLDTPLAYEELELSLTPGRTRADLARAMVDLIVRISRYAKSHRPGLLVFPQNSPELREYDGYTGAIDGIGMEDLFYRSSDEPCAESWCEENLGNARALRAAGKVVLAVDYASRAEDVRAACARYRQEGFGGYVTSRALDRLSPPCR
ncbi:endo alpha-1,4 polygalactosaminidase [Micromonospora sp. IBSANI012]|uniref:endo alpha-1,4 polygalactosaminidase n=1 Tax=Micromonospora sp. IBSANI012 TaxID=3457761 RepID=UPI0040597F5A